MGAVEGRFAGKTIIVTGAGHGIGHATATRLVAEGARVVACDIATDRLDALAAELPGIETVAGDLADDAVIEQIVAKAGDRIWGLANVAGVMDEFHATHEVPDAIWDRVFAVNVTAVMRLTRAVLPSMIAAKEGSVVIVSSESGLRGSGAGTAYTASKHAAIGIMRSTAFLYKDLGIRCNAIAPGRIRTGIPAPRSSEFTMERIMPVMAVSTGEGGEAHVIADGISYLLSDDASFVTGAVLPIDGGWGAI